MNKQYKPIKQDVVEIYKQYISSNRQNPGQTIAEIDKAIGGITAVYFNTGKRFTIANHNFCVSLPYNKGKRKDNKPVFALAYTGYLRAQQNGSIRPGEVHVDKKRSTKGHKAGLDALLNAA